MIPIACQDSVALSSKPRLKCSKLCSCATSAPVSSLENQIKAQRNSKGPSIVPPGLLTSLQMHLKSRNVFGLHLQT